MNMTIKNVEEEINAMKKRPITKPNDAGKKKPIKNIETYENW